MAKYTVKYACGHEDTIQLYGSHKDREWRLAREEEKLCPDCYRKKVEEERKKQNEEAAKANQEAGLPALVGTEKQIAWAETIRKEIIEAIETKVFGRMGQEKIKQRPDLYDNYRKAFEMLKKHTDASWWIDNNPPIMAFDLLYSMLNRELNAMEKAAKEPPAALIEQEKAEATVYPQNAVSNLVAEISIVGNTLMVKYPEYNEKFREIMRKHDFKWSHGWSREIKPINGTIQDRAVEIGNKLLAAGFPIRIYDKSLRERAIAGDYEPECHRWVLLREAGAEYVGWLSIKWDEYDDKLYRAAKRIAGARWSQGAMMAPVESYDEVLDFAKMYGFKISERAQVAINNAKAIKEKSLVTGIKVPDSAKLPEPGAKPPKLEVPKEVDVDESLRDQD